jgi:predicted short-subunit dehydrogenase-like oxidoreductase (DUF2520 family)
VVGPGRAGGSVAGALAGAGWQVLPSLGRDDDLAGAARGVDVLVVATPDAAVAGTASAIEPDARTVVVHLAGSLTLDALAPHPRRASLHPLVPLPDATSGAVRLREGVWFAIAGSAPGELAVVQRAVDDLGGHAVSVADADRARYHAAACVAANHLVALLGQVERLAAPIGVPLEAYLALAGASLDDVGRVGAAAALTGPVARRDWDTVARHVAALPDDERAAYLALALAAHRLVAEPGEVVPEWLAAPVSPPSRGGR